MTKMALNMIESRHFGTRLCGRRASWRSRSCFLILQSTLCLVTIQAVGQQPLARGYTGRPPWNGHTPHLATDIRPKSTDGELKARYSVIAIPPLSGKASSFVTLSRAVNNQGVVVGYSYNGSLSSADLYLTALPFVWQEGHIRDLPLLSGWSGAFAFGINDVGQIVGTSNKVDTNSQIIQTAVIWDHGKIHNLGELLSGASISFASDVNNWGRVVGAYFNSDETREIPFALFRGKVDVLPLLPGMTDAEPGRINDFGEIIGEQFSNTASVPCVWYWDGTGYVALDLGSLGGTQGLAIGINELGVIVGGSNLAGDQQVHSFLWFGRMQDLGTLPGDTNSLAYNINDKNQIVGLSGTATTTRTFLLEHGVLADLQDLVPPGTAPFNDSVGQINDHGDIPVDTLNSDGSQSAFLLMRKDD